VNTGFVKASNVFVTDVDPEKKSLAKKQMGFISTYNAEQMALTVDVLIIAVKPHQYEAVIHDFKEKMRKDTIVVSIAAGLTISTLEGYFDKQVKIIRTMPNTPAMVGEGMTAMMPNGNMKPADIELIQNIFSSFGKVEIVDEALIDGVIVTSGSSPAYVYMMIEAMIQGGMNEGMTRGMAARFASQAVLGAAKMVLETGIDPNDLRDAVCSPNGTTIEAVNYLNSQNFDGIVKGAMNACAERSREMSKS
jgi:pyrroline-5-carboxylate reductase